MPQLEQRLQNLQQALQQLEERTEDLERLLITNQRTKDLMEKQESVIKCFEFSYELLWKSLKDYLAKYHGLAIASPKKVFHECLAVKFTNDEETDILLAMAESRNATSHEYNYNMAQDVSVDIMQKFCPLMKLILQKLNDAIKGTL